MNLLDANDRPGQYPASWYAATAPSLPPFAPLRDTARADLCIVGGGYTGLSAALAAAQAGLDVVLVEAQRVGFGASGRNGGQVGSGQRLGQAELERRMGPDDARALWTIAEEAKARLRGLIDTHLIDAQWRDGIVHADWHARDVPDTHAEAAHLADRYGYPHVEPLDRDGIAALIASPGYAGGSVDWGAGHIHPLRFAFGLARAAADAGARIHEQSRAVAIHPGDPVEVRLAGGAIVRARHLILAGNGYLGGLAPKAAARVLPINNFIVATEPLPEPEKLITRGVAVADSRFVVNYYRLSPDGRLLFGGGESYGDRFPRDIAATVRRPMLETFPQLRGVRITHAWGGTLAITRHRLPAFLRLGPNVLSASGYSGHGVALATLAGEIMAQAVLGQAGRFDVMARLPTPAFPGGAKMRHPILALAMRWFALRDRLGI